jgi:hypothetical protein
MSLDQNAKILEHKYGKQFLRMCGKFQYLGINITGSNYILD